MTDAARLQRLNDQSEWLKRRGQRVKPDALKAHSVPRQKAIRPQGAQRSLYFDRGGRIGGDVAPELRQRAPEGVFTEPRLEE